MLQRNNALECNTLRLSAARLMTFNQPRVATQSEPVYIHYIYLPANGLQLTAHFRYRVAEMFSSPHLFLVFLLSLGACLAQPSPPDTTPSPSTSSPPTTAVPPSPPGPYHTAMASISYYSDAKCFLPKLPTLLRFDLKLSISFQLHHPRRRPPSSPQQPFRCARRAVLLAHEYRLRYSGTASFVTLFLFCCLRPRLPFAAC